MPALIASPVLAIIILLLDLSMNFVNNYMVFIYLGNRISKQFVRDPSSKEVKNGV